MITLYKRGKTFWADCSDSGTRTRVSLKTRDKQVAEALRRQMELDLLSGGRLRAKPWNEFSEEFFRWVAPQVRPSTLRGYKYVVARFTDFLLEMRIENVCDISPAVLSQFTDRPAKEVIPPAKMKKPSTPGGHRFDLRVMHRIFSYAVECHYSERNPVRARSLNSIPGQTMPFDQAEIDKLLGSPYLKARPRELAIVLLFLHTGLRIGDVISFRKSALSENIIIKTGKRGTTVSMRLHPEARAAIDAHLARQNALQRRSELLFTTDTGKSFNNLPKVLSRLFENAGISGGHAHRFRDTFAVRLLSKGASLYDVAKLMGISVFTAERHYSPWVIELQLRAARLIDSLDYLNPENCDGAVPHLLSPSTLSPEGKAKPSRAAPSQRTSQHAKSFVVTAG